MSKIVIWSREIVTRVLPRVVCSVFVIILNALKQLILDRFCFLVNGKGLSVHGAAKQLKMPLSIADYWYKKQI